MNRMLFLASAAIFAAPTPALAAQAPAAPSAEFAAPAARNSAELARFFEDYDAAQLALSPLGKAYRGIVDEDYGRWGDFGDESDRESFALQQRAAETLRERFDRASLSPQDQLSYDLFLNQAARSAAAFPFRRHGYVFNQMGGAHQQLPAFMINIHRVTDLATAEAYVSRLGGMGDALDQAIEESRIRAEAGVMPPRWVYPLVINASRNVIGGAPYGAGEDSALYADLKAKLGGAPIPEADKARLIEAGRVALVERVRPAYERLIAEMERQRALAPGGDGAWRLPDGPDYYAERLRYHTTTDMTPDQVHELGLREVARIHGEMREIMAQVGFEGTLPQFFEHVRTGDDYFHTSREEYLAQVAEVFDRTAPVLPQWFNTVPRAPLEVKAVEPFREQTAGKAFYQRPAPDGSRPGVYYVNLYDLRDMSKNELEALAFHEGIPGHHLQLAIQTELGDVPPFRKFGGVTVYSEGWGLYSEELANDMGLYTGPYDQFGRLGMELWRAARLVVDTGLHHKRWSREQAIQWLQENTPNPEGDIRRAIERYVVMPGQATAYMIGKLKIMELRDRARAALGNRFDIRDFHDVVLLSGPVPLDILERNVNQWIESQGG
jgi:uncharacterized protein (DUF885 family)